MPGCGKAITVYIPTKYSSKAHSTTCGSTSIYGTMNLCDECEKVVENPPAHTYEDAGEADYQDWNSFANEYGYYDE